MAGGSHVGSLVRSTGTWGLPCDDRGQGFSGFPASYLAERPSIRKTIFPRECPFSPRSNAWRACSSGSTVSTKARKRPVSIRRPISSSCVRLGSTMKNHLLFLAPLLSRRKAAQRYLRASLPVSAEAQIVAGGAARLADGGQVAIDSSHLANLEREAAHSSKMARQAR